MKWGRQPKLRSHQRGGQRRRNRTRRSRCASKNESVLVALSGAGNDSQKFFKVKFNHFQPRNFIVDEVLQLLAVASHGTSFYEHGLSSPWVASLSSRLLCIHPGACPLASAYMLACQHTGGTVDLWQVFFFFFFFCLT